MSLVNEYIPIVIGVWVSTCASYVTSPTLQEELPGYGCSGDGKCSLGMPHPPVNTEFCIGCGLCRRERENAVKF